MSKRKKTSKKKNRKPKSGILREIVEIFSINPYQPLNLKQLCSRLGVMDHASRQLVEQMVYQLMDENMLERVSRSKFRLNPEIIESVTVSKTIEGRVEMKSTGKAYVISDALDEDVFIASNNTGKAFDADRVEVLLFPQRGKRKREGKIIKILERAREVFVGKIEISKQFAFVVPDKTSAPTDFFIPLSKINGAKNGDKVIIRFTEWPDRAKNPFGEVTEVLGKPGDNEVEMKSILASNDFPVSFPDVVVKNAHKVSREISSEELKRRRDFRDVLTVTIDPADAKDFDDALSIRRMPNGLWQVGVHIADVSHYVKKGSAIDKEAYKRGTSIYLVDRVIPMLPEVLSNDVCSLRPQEEKLTFSAVFEMNDEAEIKKEWFGKTIIKSNRRYAYEEVQEMIEGAPGDENKEMLMKLNALATKLRQERFRKGSIAFRSQEVRFILDENGKPKGAYIREQKDAHRLIEDFMLLANRKVAEKIGKAKSSKTKAKTFVYRIHDVPNPEKIQVFSEFVRKLGYRISLANRKSLVMSLNKLFEDVRGKGEEHLVETIAVRTMAKAVYSTENIGHYGLAFKYYTHFTSPIRRYPDLMVHRLLEHYLNGGGSVNANEYEEYCRHSSDMERKAVDAERESVRLKQAEYMLDKVGEEFYGVISGVSKYGCFVEVEEVKAEGLVSIGSLTDDYYYLDEDNYQIIGRRYGHLYRLGDKVRVRVNRVDLVKKQIDLSFVD